MSPSYVIWVTLTLKEEGLWSLLLVTATVLLLRLQGDPKGGRKLAVVISMMLLVRPEAMLWCLVCALLAAVVRISDPDRAETSDHALLPLITYGCVLLSVTVFRVIYFGVPLPNTFYAKVSPSLAYNLRTGAEYFLAYFRSGLLIRFAVLILAIYVVLSVLDIVQILRSVARRDAPESIWKNRLEVFPLLVATCLLIPVLVGGDHFVGYRFFQPAYPLLVLSPFMFMKYLERKGLIRWVFAPRGAAITGFVLLLLAPVFALSQQVTWFNVERTLPITHEFKIAESGRIIGGLMSRVFSELESYPSVGLVTVGGIKYGYEGPVDDLMGLNNSVIGRSRGDRKGFKAHAAFERQLFFAVEPEVLWDADWDSRCVQDLQGHHDGHGFRWLDDMLEGVLSDPGFLAEYRYGQIGLRSSPHGPCVRGFLRLDFIDTASQADRLHVTVLP